MPENRFPNINPMCFTWFSSVRWEKKSMKLIFYWGNMHIYFKLLLLQEEARRTRVRGTVQGRPEKKWGRQGRRDAGRNGGQSPVVWEWSSALHRGWWFLLFPSSHPTPLTSSPFSPPPPPPLLWMQLHEGEGLHGRIGIGAQFGGGRVWQRRQGKMDECIKGEAGDRSKVQCLCMCVIIWCYHMSIGTCHETK